MMPEWVLHDGSLFINVLVFILVIRIEARSRILRERVDVMHRMLSIWCETWGQPPEEVKRLLTQATYRTKGD